MLAIAVCQPVLMLLTRRYREHARSHIRLGVVCYSAEA